MRSNVKKDMNVLSRIARLFKPAELEIQVPGKRQPSYSSKPLARKRERLRKRIRRNLIANFKRVAGGKLDSNTMKFIRQDSMRLSNAPTPKQLTEAKI